VAAPVTTTGASPPIPAGQSAGVLLVDDQPARLLTYRAILEPLGEDLHEASSGRDALRQLMLRDFAVILLDVNMPDIDGFETAALIHQHPRFEKTPIIFVTAVNVSDLDRIRGYELGAVDYVTVPVIPEILRSKVAVMCELHRKRQELQRAYDELAVANEALRIEKSRELEALNESLRIANDTLAARNGELQRQVHERESVERQLIELGQRKDEFLATLAHELRNPLAALSNAIHVLALSPEDGSSVRRTMERQTRLLVRLIDDLLDAARIGRGKLALKPVATRLDAVLDAAIEAIAPLLAAGNRSLQLHKVRGNDDVVLSADPERLSQVFSNLLSNAVKYSDAGAVITLETRTHPDWVDVAVADDGIGLTRDQVLRIFEPFHQVDTSVERSRGGLGIGLTLARQIVEMHGGELSVQSAGPGEGSCFTVRLPLPANVPHVVTESPRPEPSPHACRALVVDDNHDSADTLAMLLQLLGHEVRCVYDPVQAAAIAAEFAPDVVFLDLGMPRMSGHDVARALRSGKGGSGIVLVAVTGWGQPEDRQRTREAGFDHHLVKPVDLAVVSAICAGLACSPDDAATPGMPPGIPERDPSTPHPR
jgi:signal transduction histidine kinase